MEPYNLDDLDTLYHRVRIEDPDGEPMYDAHPAVSADLRAMRSLLLGISKGEVRSLWAVKQANAVLNNLNWKE